MTQKDDFIYGKVPRYWVVNMYLAQNAVLPYNNYAINISVGVMKEK
jgi:hypothetical protein